MFIKMVKSRKSNILFFLNKYEWLIINFFLFNILPELFFLVSSHYK